MYGMSGSDLQNNGKLGIDCSSYKLLTLQLLLLMEPHHVYKKQFHLSQLDLHTIFQVMIFFVS